MESHSNKFCRLWVPSLSLYELQFVAPGAQTTRCSIMLNRIKPDFGTMLIGIIEMNPIPKEFLLPCVIDVLPLKILSSDKYSDQAFERK